MSTVRTAVKSHLSLILALVLPLAALLIAVGFTNLPVGKRMEFVTVDSRFQSRAASDPHANPRILLVGISEQGLENFGRWPWPRSIHGQLLQFLTVRPPKAIAFDLLFTETSQDAEQDVAFADGLALHTGSITGASSEDLGHLGEGEVQDAVPGEWVGNTPALTNVEGDISLIRGEDYALMPVRVVGESSMTGFVNVDPSLVDGVRRKAPVVVRAGDHVYPSLVLQSLMRTENLGPEDVEVVLGKHIKINGEKEQWTIPVDERGRMWINYRGTNAEGANDVFEGTGAISYFGLAYFLQTYIQSLQADENAAWPEHYETLDGDKVPLPPVQDQYLVIGQTAAGLTDFGATPMGTQTPLVKVHATILNNILQEDYLRIAAFWPLLIGWLIIAYGTVVPLRNSPVLVSLLVPAVIIGAFVGVTYWIFDRHSLHVPIVWPALGFLLAHGSLLVYRLISEAQAKGRIKAMFSTYVAPEVVDQLIESGEEPQLGGEETEITAFFSDIQSFSAFSEKLTPTQLVTLMNEYLSEMSHILKYAGSGTLDKFIGDAIVGIFGAPYHYPDHAWRACITTVEVQKRQAELREEWREKGGWPEIVYSMQTRVGLNTGLAVVGNMGARDRMNYTMMGDTVNLAARCESGAKSYGVFSMITGETKAAAEATKDDMAFRYLEKIIVKGRTQPVVMYELVGLKKELTQKTCDCLDTYAKAMEKYLAQDWDGARKLFEESEGKEPFRRGDPGVGGNASLVMMDRCEAMKANPPGDDWDGVFVMKTK